MKILRIGVAALTLASCLPEPVTPPVCVSHAASRFGPELPASADTLDIVLALPDGTDSLEMLVRVDPFGGDDPFVVIDRPPPRAAAAGVALTTDARFSVCIAALPEVIVFQGERVPHDKAWVRVMTDRPVRAVVRLGGEEGRTLEPPVVVVPGESARHAWPGTAPTGLDR